MQTLPILLLLLPAGTALFVSPRRAHLQQAAAAAAAAAAAFPLVAPAVADEDPLVTRLRDAQSRLESAQFALNEGNIDQVRQAVKAAVTPLTMKGYLGSSVKSRAQDSGSTELLQARTTLLKNLGIVDKWCYDRQTSFGQSSSDSTIPTSALRESVVAIDKVIELL
eukprot:jgi/Chrpa1/21140/Chrysochromulina_OHIO_Genome00007122-RA